MKFDPERCTHQSFKALTGHLPDRPLLTGVDMLEALRRDGYITQLIGHRGQYGVPKTVLSFCREGRGGKYYLWSSGHAMAFVNGQLVDTELKGPDRRRIQGLYRILPTPGAKK